jgi:quercetin 2,3-dioxygenase
VYGGLFTGDERAELALNPQRICYVHLVRGALRVNGQVLRGGDAARLDAENQLLLSGGEDAEVLVFDLAA